MKLLKRSVLHSVTLLLFSLFLVAAPAFGLQGKLNINQAGMAELQKLPFVGKGRAQAIIDYRQQNGSFASLEDLQEIPAIGQSTYEAIHPYLTLSGPHTLQDQDEEEKKDSISQVFPLVNTSPGQIIMLPDKLYYQTLTSFIKQAQDSIDLSMYIFKTTKSAKNRPALLVKELGAAQKRGVQVRVVLEKSGYDDGLNKENQSTAKKLLSHNIKVYFDSDKQTTHSKIVVIDRRFSFIGSHNLTHSALSRNHEYSLLIDSEPLAKELVSYIDSI